MIIQIVATYFKIIFQSIKSKPKIYKNNREALICVIILSLIIHDFYMFR